MKTISQQKVFAGILIIGILLRCLFISTREIQYDDAFSILLAQRDISAILEGTAADTMPPLFYILLHFWLKISKDLWFIRLLSLIFSIASMYVLYKLIELLINQKAALWSMLIVAISPMQIFHAQDVRMYSLLLFSLLCYLYFFVRILNSQKNSAQSRSIWLGLIISGTISLYTHNLAIFMIIVPNIILLMKRLCQKQIKLLAAQFLIFLFALPWLIIIPQQIRKVQTAFWTPRPGLVEITQSILLSMSTLPLPDFWLKVSLFICIFTLAMLLIVIVGDIRKNTNLLSLVIIALTPPLLMFILSFFMRPLFITRGFITSIAAFYGLAGFGIHKMWDKGTGKIILIMFFLAAGIGLPFQYTYSEFPRSPYRDMVNYLSDQVTSGDIVVHDNKLSFFPSRYYAPNLDQVFIADIPGSSNDTLAWETQEVLDEYPLQDLETAVSNSDDIYFVFFKTTVESYIKMGNSEHPSLAWLELEYESVDQIEFNDLFVHLFSAKQ